jgi:hypothetical protein
MGTADLPQTEAPPSDMDNTATLTPPPLQPGKVQYKARELCMSGDLNAARSVDIR